MARIAQHNRLKIFYQMELSEELTGKTRQTIAKRMKRNNWTLARTIKQYIKENG